MPRPASKKALKLKVWIARGSKGRLMPFSEYDRVPAVYLTRAAALRHWADVERATLTLDPPSPKPRKPRP